MGTCYVLTAQSLNTRIERVLFLEMGLIIWLQFKYIIIIRLQNLINHDKEHKL